MAGPIVWWANRKSKNGLRPLAKEPPHLPNGKEWWTSPPTAVPQPEHIEYVVQFQIEVMSQRQTQTRDTLLKSIAEWLRAARRLLHEEFSSERHADLNTTDGLFIAARDLLEAVTGKAIRAGYSPSERDQATLDAIRARAARARRERAMESSKRRSAP